VADSIFLSDEEQGSRGLTEIVFGLWDVINNLTRLTPTRRPEFRVSIFGSARIPRDHWVHAAVRDLAKQRAQAETSASAAPLFARLHQSRTAPNMGIRVHLPFEQGAFELAPPEDIEIPRCVDTVYEAVAP
jgi:hypothetical protein